jgi:uncharacterized protein (TIGR02145 family)
MKHIFLLAIAAALFIGCDGKSGGPILLYDDSEDALVSSSSKVQSSSSSKKGEKTSSSSVEDESSSSAKEESSSSEKAKSSSSVIITVDGFVLVDTKFWMKKNLDIEVEGSRCYDDKTSNCEKYGRLYTWAQAMEIDDKYNTEQLGAISLPHQGICPDGTHLPSTTEWKDLFAYVANHREYREYFTNQLGGAYDYRNFYRDEDYEALFWSSTEYEVTSDDYRYEYAWIWAFHVDNTTAKDNAHKVTGGYVRCVKNGVVGEPSSSAEDSSSVESSSSEESSSSSIKEVVLADSDFVEINSVLWTKKNLDIEVQGSKCYEDLPANCEKFGRLYTWAQAMKIDDKYNTKKLGDITVPHQGICPAGTHLPSNTEWSELVTYLVKHSDDEKYFTNQLGGAFDYKGQYRSEGYEALFWSSTEYEVTDSFYEFEFAWLWAFHNDNTTATDNAHKITGAYVRCIKNAAP